MQHQDNIFELSDKKIDEVGEKFTGKYSTDLNISVIHLLIRNIFSFNIQERVNYEKRVSLIDKFLEQVSAISSKDLISEKERLLAKIINFSDINWLKYTKEIRHILDEYSKITTYKKHKKFHIGGTVASDVVEAVEGADTGSGTDISMKYRLDIITQFLRIAGKYIEMDFIFYPPYQIGCDICDQNIQDMDIDDDLGVYMCKCGLTFDSVHNNENTNIIDPERIPSSIKNSYDDKTNFVRRLKSYQGIKTKKISDEFLDFLDEHMQTKYKLPPCSEIREMEIDRYGHRGSTLTSVSLLIEILRETGHSLHFQDINPICYDLWGWICPSIDSLVPKILDDYTRTQEVYKKLFPQISSMNVDLRLYWHLRIAGHECLLDDFKIPQSKESRKRNSFIFKTLCKETGLEFFPIL